MSFSVRPILSLELWIQISRFTDLNDAITCARVCKVWNDLFTSAIWHTINFESQCQRARLEPTTVRKHGHRIRAVKNLSRTHDLRVLHGSGVCHLRRLNMILEYSTGFQAFSVDFIRQNASSLTELDIQMLAEDMMWSSKIFFPIDAISTRCAGGHATLNLTQLKISGLAFTRAEFAFFLQMCPALKNLEVFETVLYSDSSCSEPFRHPGLVQLRSNLSQVLQPDPDLPSETSLLAHFPNLQKFMIWNPTDLLPPSMSSQTIQEEFARYCPLLKQVHIVASATLTATLLTQSLTALSFIAVDYEIISSDVLIGILNHRETLEWVGTLVPARGYYDQDEVPKLETSVSPILGWVIQLVPQQCSRLKTFRLPCIEMDMDDIEKKTWSCSHLEELFIRIRGLDTKDMIKRAMELWINARRRKSGKDSHEGNHQREELALVGYSLEERVSRHLLRFDKLQRVWLGHKMRVVRLELESYGPL